VHPTAGSPPPVRPTVDARRLWAGGAATAVVAGLVAVVGVLIGDAVLDAAMVEPPLLPIGDSFALRYVLTAAALALVATGLAHLLALTTPRPRAFFSWIVGLATVVGVVLPFTSEGSFGGRLATALLNLVLGLCVLSLLSSVLARTTRLPQPAPPGWTADPGPGR
jgi:uncharacterized membrane protein YGL010W